MSIVMNLYYTGENGNARRFAVENVVLVRRVLKFRLIYWAHHTLQLR